MSKQLKASLVRIFLKGDETTPIGVGFRVLDNYVLTCAHVVTRALELRDRCAIPPDDISLDFPLVAPKEILQAHVVGWHPEDKEDVAILQVTGNLPNILGHYKPPLLGIAAGTKGHKIITFGFPNAGEIDGVFGTGTVVELGTRTKGGQLLLQIRSSEITKGFSGAPIWDESRRRVIGMVVIIAKPDGDGRLDETAFAIPTETLRMVYPSLRVSDVCPYRNLDAFTEDDARFFFGRERAITNLIDSLKKEPTFLAVLGPSGSGKSSVVQAGLIPRLRKGVVPGSDYWKIIVTRPTDHIFENLVAGLQQIQQHTVLIIDQFEEIFVALSCTIQQDILTQLAELLEHSPDISIILTLRDDFYSRFVQQERFAQCLRRGLVNIPPFFTREELTDIVQKPAELLGLKFEPGLVEAIIKDAMETVNVPEEHNRVGASTILPLLEFTLTQIWERREDGVLTHAAYEKIGRVTGSLTQWAGRELTKLDKQQRSLARRIFTDLVYLGDEEQRLPNSRRRRLLNTLCRTEDEREDVEHVVYQLVDARLLVTSRNPQAMTEEIEIIHDALLREWSELKQWLEEDRRFLNWRQEVERRAEAWRKTSPDNPAQREVDSLLRGRDLAIAVYWLAERRTDLDQFIWDFVETSQERQQQEEQKWEKLYLESERRRKVIFARDLAIQAEWIRSQQIHKLQLALLLALESMQLSPSPKADQLLREGLPLLPRLLTCKIYDTSIFSMALSPDGHLLAVATKDHPVEIYTMPDGHCITKLEHNDIIWAVTFSPDGHSIATASNDRTVKLWNIYGDKIGCFKHNSGVLKVIFSPDPDGRYLVTKSLIDTVTIWEIATERVLFQHSYKLAVSALTISPDGRYLAIASHGHTFGSETGSAILLEISTLRCIDLPHNNMLSKHKWHIESFIFDPDSRYLVIRDGGLVDIWDINKEELIYIEHQGTITSVAFHPKSKYLVTGDDEGTIEVWYMRNEPRLYRRYRGHKDAINAITFSPDGIFIATASEDGTANLWETASGKQSLSFAHETSVKDLIISPDGRYLITASKDQMVRIWETRSTSSSICLTHNGPVKALSFSPSNILIATASDDQTVRIWEVASGVQIQCFNHCGKVRSIAFHPDGNTILTASYDRTVKRWDVRNGSELACLSFQEEVWKVVFSPDGRYFATSGRDHTARIWDASTHRLIAGLFAKGVVNDITFSADSRYLAASLGATLGIWNINERRYAFSLHSAFPLCDFSDIAFSPNEQYLAVVNGHSTRIWKITTSQELNTLAHDQDVWGITFSPDSRYIATASQDHTARVWDICNGKQVANLAHKDTVWDVAFSPDGKYIATASWDSTACIWEIKSGSQIACLTHKDSAFAVKFSFDGKHVATASKDHTARIWLWQPDDMINKIRSRLTRNLTREEWEQYFGDEPYSKTCPNLP